ncbi:MAG: TPM domain-containing protein [candidate division KSB1 bacterium]|nr:TPM domain-containing protein [candidate division KSB1 bacterium]
MRVKSVRKISFVLVFVGVLAAAEWKIPSPKGAVNDFADVIPPADEQRIEELCIRVWNKARVAIVVATFPTIGDQDYREAANRVYEKWGIGSKGENRGVLIFNVVDQRKVWIETGYGVEGFLNDARVGDIFRQEMRPRLAQGDYGGAFYAAVNRIAAYVAAEYQIDLGDDVQPEPSTRLVNDDLPPFWFILVLLFFIFLSSRSRKKRGPRHRDDFPFGGPFIFGPHGGFGGGFGKGGGFGGGFGGFGGGLSGGGGAGGGY